VDRAKFEDAIDRLLKAKPLPKKKVKGNKKSVPEPMFPKK
jgi:hypothetical protein